MVHYGTPWNVRAQYSALSYIYGMVWVCKVGMVWYVSVLYITVQYGKIRYRNVCYGSAVFCGTVSLRMVW